MHQTPTTQKWDAIVIGSGLGGLTTAALLAKAGKRVLVLERHWVPGGFTQTFKRKGFEWDVGVHYVGQVGHPKAILRKIFDYVTDGQLHWAPMGEVYDKAIIEGDVYEFVTGLQNQIQRLIAYFPAEEEAIRAYYKLVQSVSVSSAWFFGEKTMPSWLSKTAGFFLRRKFEKWAKQTTYDVLRSITQNERLISVLCAQCGNYGLLPKQSSFGIHAIVVDHYLNGGSYPVGGAKRIYGSILEVFKKGGGTLCLKAEVDEILLEGGRAVGVRMKNGDRYFAPAIISNAGVRNTLQHLLPRTASLAVDAEQSLKHVQSSVSHVCLYVGLNASAEDLELPKYNLWLYERASFDGENSVTYISFPSAKDPSWPIHHPDRSTIQLIAACPYDIVKQWENKPWMKRGDDYLDFKKDFTEKLLKTLYERLPQLKGRVEYSELSTPLSTKHFTNYGQGEIYGLEHTPQRFALKWLRPRTPIKGLYLTGQDIVTVGVGGALFSGVLAATTVLNKSVIARILLNRPLSSQSARTEPFDTVPVCELHHSTEKLPQ